MEWTDFHDADFARVRAAIERWRPELSRQLECHQPDEAEVRFIFGVSHQLHEGVGENSMYGSYTLEGLQVEYAAKALALLGYFTLDKMDDPSRAAGAGMAPTPERLAAAEDWPKKPLAGKAPHRLPSSTRPAIFDKDLATEFMRLIQGDSIRGRKGKSLPKNRDSLLMLAAACIREASIVYPKDFRCGEQLEHAATERFKDNKILLDSFFELVCCVDTGTYDETYLTRQGVRVVIHSNDARTVELCPADEN